MTLEVLIFRRLVTDPRLAGVLATYAGTPAIFYQQAPADTDKGWGDKKQYPRMDYLLDLQADPSRRTSGLLTINVWCREDGISPEDIEPAVRAPLGDIFLQPADEPPYSLAWVRSDAFEQRGSEPAAQVTGITLLFDVLAFPCPITTDPDPVLTMIQWTRIWEPEAVVVGRDRTDDYYTPSAAAPAVYYRVDSLQVYQQQHAVIWMDVTLACHLFAPKASRLRWLKHLTEALAAAGEIIMPDGSPMRLLTLKADSSADALSIGQLRIAARYGILRRPPYAHPMGGITL